MSSSKPNSTKRPRSPALLKVVEDWRGAESDPSAREVLEAVRADLPNWPLEKIREALAEFKGRLARLRPLLSDSDEAHLNPDYEDGIPPSLTVNASLFQFYDGLANDLRRELVLRGEESGESSTPSEGKDGVASRPRRKPGRPSKMFRMIWDEHRRHGMRLKPKDLAEVPNLKSILDTYQNPANFVSRALSYGKKKRWP